MATLVVISGDRRGEYYPLGRRTSVIGRGESLPIQILDDSVSRKHLQIRFDRQTNTYRAIDMASRNGVFVNSERITREAVLTNRDRIRIGGTLLFFTERDFAGDSPALHRFKRAGERRRATDFDWQPQTYGVVRPVGRRPLSTTNW
jgi:pSer/pThr/pTyr-binding forkhead associated (FHA) protein